MGSIPTWGSNFKVIAMPIQKCNSDGKSGKKWGKSGKCYTGKGAARKAGKQAAAAYAHGYKGKPKLGG